MRSYQKNYHPIWMALFIIVLMTLSVEAKYRERKRERPTSYAPISTAASVDLCTKDRNRKLICHCSPVDSDVITTADCWFFFPDFPKKDSDWLAFYGHSHIKHLKFTVQHGGSLTYIPTEIIETLTNLTTFSVAFAQITEIGSYSLANLTHLVKVEFSQNQVKVLRKYAFANHPVLVEINLEHNQIMEIDRNAFTNLPILERLYLGKNNITILHEEVFAHLGKLAELQLQSNMISVLTREVFKGLGNLKILKLSSNDINFIGDTVFAELWSLQELDLRSNEIQKISERAFDGLNNLKKLDLRNNRLVSLEKGVFTVVPALKSLNLNNNHLETLTFNNFLPILDNLLNNGSILDISDNRFICDCRLSWIFDLRNRTKNEELKKTLQDLECLFYYKDNIPNDILSNAVTNKETNGKRYGSMVDSDIDMDKKKIGSDRSDYYDDQSYGNVDDTESDENLEEINDGKYVSLFKIGMENLPCPEELSDPTELPLSRESIGMDMGWHSGSASQLITKVSGSFIMIVVFMALC